MLKRLKIYYIYVALPFIAMLGGAAIYHEAIVRTITSNPHPQINYAIFTIILLGGLLILRSVHRLMQEGSALSQFADAQRTKVSKSELQQLAINLDVDIAYVLRMIAASKDQIISQQEQIAIEHELQKASSRLNGRNALPQFLTGLLVGMGLLGTFIGLLSTLSDIAALISSFADIDMGSANPIDVFRNMIERMKAPMASMGIAFSASLFGLLGSIVLGFMMVALRRCLGDIISTLGSEVAQHIEFSLSAEGFAYSKGALMRGVGGERRSAQAPIVIGGGAISSTLAPPTDLDTKPAEKPSVAIEQPVAEGRMATTLGSMTEFEGEELRVLLRIEDRLAESTRLQTQALKSELDDFNKQRSDMLRALGEHNEAVAQFRLELQRVGRQLGTIISGMEKGNSEVVAQISELMVRMSDDAAENRILMARHLEEQRAMATMIVGATQGAGGGR